MPHTNAPRSTTISNGNRSHDAPPTWRRPLLAFVASLAVSAGIPLAGGFVDRCMDQTFHGFTLWPLYADYALGLVFGVLVGLTLLILADGAQRNKRHLLATRGTALLASAASLLVLTSLNEYAILTYGILVVPYFTWTFIAIGIFAALLVAAAVKRDNAQTRPTTR